MLTYREHQIWRKTAIGNVLMSTLSLNWRLISANWLPSLYIHHFLTFMYLIKSCITLCCKSLWTSTSDCLKHVLGQYCLWGFPITPYKSQGTCIRQSNIHVHQTFDCFQYQQVRFHFTNLCFQRSNSSSSAAL